VRRGYFDPSGHRPAVARWKRGALREVISMYCERCNTLCPDDELRSYNVHYGNRIGSSVHQEMTQPNTITETRVTSYDVAGATAVSLCRRCIHRSRLRTSLIALGLTIGAFALVTVFSYSVPPLSWVGLLLFFPALIGVFVPLGKQWPDRMASRLVRKKSHTKYGGYDSFWTDKEFSQLTRK
jgi:hypothetical protein